MGRLLLATVFFSIAFCTALFALPEEAKKAFQNSPAVARSCAIHLDIYRKWPPGLEQGKLTTSYIPAAQWVPPLREKRDPKLKYPELSKDAGVIYYANTPDEVQFFIIMSRFDPRSLKIEANAEPLFPSPYLNPLPENLRSLSREIEAHLEFVFQAYADRKIVEPSTIEGFRRSERELEPYRCAYFAVTDRETGSTEALIRLYDGSDAPGVCLSHPGLARVVLDQAGRLPLEREFPQLRLPEREDGRDVYELGRLAVDRQNLDSVPHLLGFVNYYLYFRRGYQGHRPRPGSLYIWVTAQAARLYQKDYGFEVAYRSEDLGLEGDRYFILKMDIQKFFDRFHRMDLEAPTWPDDSTR